MIALFLSLLSLNVYAAENTQDFTVKYAYKQGNGNDGITCILTAKNLKISRKVGGFQLEESKVVNVTGEVEAAIEEADSVRNKMVNSTNVAYGYNPGDLDITAVSSKVKDRVVLKTFGRVTSSQKAFELINLITSLCR
jgi:hypothetical protein